MNLTEAILKKKRLVLCGSGGVGKTTLAAAIALEAARRGRRSIVLTIDPARRLASALGLKELLNEPKEVPLSQCQGRLHAMMLDTKRAFDHLIRKYAPSPSACEAILENRLYQEMSSMISGSQEYMAMEQLYELNSRPEFDLLVLDTPPTRHALDFLDAPQKMAHLTSSSLVKFFLMPGLFASRTGLGLLQKGIDRVFEVFDRLAGLNFLKDLSRMISLLGDLLGGFHQRAEGVSQLLKSETTGFLLVTGTASITIQDALFFRQKISEAGLPFLGFLVNRVFPEVTRSEMQKIAGLPGPLQNKLIEAVDRCRALSLRDQNAIQVLKKMGGKKAFCQTIPALAEDVHNLEGLMRINEFLS